MSAPAAVATVPVATLPTLPTLSVDRPVLTPGLQSILNSAILADGQQGSLVVRGSLEGVDAALTQRGLGATVSAYVKRLWSGETQAGAQARWSW